MSSELNCCANVIRALLIIVNIVFAALGLAVLGVGIWAVVRASDLEAITGSDISSGGAIYITSGIVTLIICGVGILGGILKNRPLLVIYAVVVLFITILEIVAAILVFVYWDEVRDRLAAQEEEEDEASGEGSGGVGEGSGGQASTLIIQAIMGYRFAEDAEDRNETVNAFIEDIQNQYNCCGDANATDWIVYNQMNVMLNGGRPPACIDCGHTVSTMCAEYTFDDNGFPVSFNTTTLGCRSFVTTPAPTTDATTATDAPTPSGNITEGFVYAVGGVGVAFAISEILGIVLSLILCCCITSALKQEKV